MLNLNPSDFSLLKLPPEISTRIDQAVGPLNSAGFDPWGLDPETLKRSAALGRWFYKHYFRVTTHGLGRLPTGRVMVVANHSGQLPVDALMVAMALLTDATPARIPRGMVDHWVPSLPFISDLFSRSGAVVGSPLNCLDLLRAEQCVMVFPEGTRGLGKPFSKRYQLQNFGTGFMRLAIEAKTPIVPVAVIGAEEIYPGAFNIEPLAKLLGTPYFPIPPLLGLLGPLGALPLPAQISLRFGEPMSFEADPDMTDSELMPLIDQVKKAIVAETRLGLKARGNDIFGLRKRSMSARKSSAKGAP
jgi:1-acyl-sn-glycerol-3-phosphate acyltransferase